MAGKGQSVAGFFGLLGLKIDKGAWAAGQKQIDGMKQAVLGLGAYFGAQALGKALIGANAKLEDSKNLIAGMLAVAKNSDLSAELGTAGTLMDNLVKRASKLPGSAGDYINMLSGITQPIVDAKLGMQDLEDISVRATVAALGLGIAWDVAARDIDQAIRGQFKSTDAFMGKILGGAGFKGEAGRAKFNALSETKRAEMIKAALARKQWDQLGEAQGNTFSGALATFKDQLSMTLQRVGLPLFKALTTVLKEVNAWFEKHKESIAAVADMVGGALVSAFDALGEVFTFLTRGSDEAIAILVGIGAAILAYVIPALASMAAGWLLALGPIALIIAAVAAVVFVIRKYGKQIVAAFRRVWEFVAYQAKWVGGKVIGAWRAVGEFFEDVGRGIIRTWEDVVAYVLDAVEDVKKAIYDLGKAIINSPLGSAAGMSGWRGVVESLDGQGAPKGGTNRTNLARERAGLPPLPASTVPVPTVTSPGAQSTRGPVTQDNSVAITINPSPGMDERKIGDEVRKRLDDHWRRLADNRGIG